MGVQELEEFVVVRLLSSSSSAVVLQCRPRGAALARLMPQLALKCMVPSSKWASKDVYREYAMLAGLAHDNVVRMYWVKGPVQPTAAMLGSVVDGSVRDLMVNHMTGAALKTTAAVLELHRCTLRQHYEQQGGAAGVAAAHKRRMCGDLVSALLYVWQQRLVHLDVSLDNVLVAEDGRLVLSDFGSAQQVDAEGCLEFGSAPLLGNQQHMAPEVLRALGSQGRGSRVQASGQPCWECGTMMHEMVMGWHPFAAYPLHGLEAEQYEAVDAASLVGAAADQALADVTLGLLQWAPDARMSLHAAQARLH